MATTETRPQRPVVPPARRGRQVLRWGVRGVALVVVLALLYVASVAFRVWSTARLDQRPRSDAIIVLGASQWNGRPSPALQARLDHALALYQDGVADRVVTTGANQPGDRFTEAGSGRTYLIGKGVPADAIVSVPVGSDTLQSLRAVREVFDKRGWSSAVIVTDPWHSFRSKRMASDLGLTVATSPTRSGPVVSSRGIEVRYIARETAAYLYYRVTGSSPDSGSSAY